MIELKNVTKTYAEGNQSLTDVNLQINKGEFVFIVGGSGSGKTTLLKMLIAEDKPTSGSIRVADQSLESIKRRQIAEYRRKIGIVFRDFRLFHDKTVYENVAFALRVTGEPSGSIRTKVMASLQMVELSDQVKCYPADLTSCEQQRVALARAIAGGPNVIIADEPCGNIDPVESRDLLELFGRIQSRYEKTVVVLTHDRELAESFGYRIVYLRRGQIVDERAAYVPDELKEVTLPEEPSAFEEELLLPTAEPIVEVPLPVATAALDELPCDDALLLAVGDNPTIEYDLEALIAAGEMDAHTASDLIQAAEKILNLSEPDKSVEETSHPTEADFADSTVELPILPHSEELPGGQTDTVDDEPTVIIPVIDPDTAGSAKEGND